MVCNREGPDLSRRLANFRERELITSLLLISPDTSAAALAQPGLSLGGECGL